MTLAAVLGATKAVAALAFFAVLLAIFAGYRALARRLELERAEEVLTKEFERLETEAYGQKAGGVAQRRRAQ